MVRQRTEENGGFLRLMLSWALILGLFVGVGTPAFALSLGADSGLPLTQGFVCAIDPDHNLDDGSAPAVTPPCCSWGCCALLLPPLPSAQLIGVLRPQVQFLHPIGDHDSRPRVAELHYRPHSPRAPPSPLI